MKDKYETRYSENYGGECIFLKRGQDPPSAGVDPKDCSHPGEYTRYIEWEIQGTGLGHGWYCSLCGEIVQYG